MESVPMEYRPFTISFSASVLAHLFFFALLMLWAGTEVKPLLAPDRTVFVVVEPPRVKRRVVQSQAGEKADEPAPDSFLGEANRRVDQETIARKRAERAAQPRTGARPLSSLGVTLVAPADPVAREQDTAPDWADYSDDPYDYVEGVPETDRTALNTKEFVFYGYFQRIRSRLELAWEPILKRHLIRMQKTGRNLASDRDYVTRTLVTLNDHGEIVRVQIVEESGTRDLDEAAVKAFNEAGPFPNPPKGLIESDGKIQLRWDFVLRTS